MVKTCSLGTSFPPRNKGDLCVGLEARQGVWHNDRWGAFLECGWKRGGLCASALFPQRALFRPARRLWLPPRRLTSSWAGALDVSERRSPVRGKTDVRPPPPPRFILPALSIYAIYNSAGLARWTLRRGLCDVTAHLRFVSCDLAYYGTSALARKREREREKKTSRNLGFIAALNMLNVKGNVLCFKKK